MSFISDPTRLLTYFDSTKGTLGDAPLTKRYLSDLRGCFCDAVSFEKRLARDNPLVYTVAAVEDFKGKGDLHFGLGTIYPGRVGEEYFLTKGHLHTWRAAAEIYIGLAGQGMMLLEDEASKESRTVTLAANGIVYVPGHTAHRTINTSDVPLVYLGVYPATAGHDYGAIAEQNFSSIVVERDGHPCVLRRRNL